MEIDFYFDLMCPFAYQTSVWMREVRDQADVQVNWRFFSLEEINREEGKKHPWEREWSFGWSQMRIAALIKRELGNDELDRWYEGMGKAF
ncbi:MAG: DsbA family protein, partial [Acidimicrobiales bacterium]